MKLTPEELETEWAYVYAERLGILCEDREPTPEQCKMAREEADAAVKDE